MYKLFNHIHILAVGFQKLVHLPSELYEMLEIIEGHALCIKLKSYETLQKLFSYHREGENTANTCFALAVYPISEVIISSPSKCHNLGYSFLLASYI